MKRLDTHSKMRRSKKPHKRQTEPRVKVTSLLRLSEILPQIKKPAVPKIPDNPNILEETLVENPRSVVIRIK